MTERRSISCLLAAAALFCLPGKIPAQSACGPFTDVSANDVFCPFILQAFVGGLTNGTSATTFSPTDPVTREQVVTFVNRGIDSTLNRGNLRTAMGKTWGPTSTFGATASDVGGSMNDIVTDGTNLWIARNDGKIVKASVADRRVLETWGIATGSPRRLGVFGGLVFVADNQGNLQYFNPTSAPVLPTMVASSALVPSNFAALAYDGTNVWMANANTSMVLIAMINSVTTATFDMGANVDGLLFDGTYMWVLLANSKIQKMSLPSVPSTPPSVVETLTIPGPVTDCRMVFDGVNIWLPTGSGTLYVIRPTTNALPSTVTTVGAIAGVGLPYVAAFDGENVMIGGVSNGVVALYKASSLTPIRSFPVGASGIRGIASDGRTFNIGDIGASKFFQY